MIRKVMLLVLITMSQFVGKSQDFKLNAILDQEVSCKGNKDGSIQSSCIPDGNYKYTISRSTFTQTNNSGIFRDLVPGVYKITATNGKVTKSSKVTVTEPKVLNVKFVVDKYPSNTEGGILNVEVSGGTADLQPYLVTWRNGKGDILNTENLFSLSQDNLKPDIYTVTIEDDHGCFLTKAYRLAKKK